MTNHILTRHKTFARAKYCWIEVDYALLGLEDSSWMRRMLSERAHRSVHRPEHRSSTETVLGALKVASAHDTWRAFCNTSVSKLSHQQVLDQFESLERYLLEVRMSDVRRRAMSISARQWILAFLVEAGVPKIDRVSRLFASRLTTGRVKPRALISDFSHVDAQGRPFYPIGAMPHTDVAELRKQIHERLQLDLASITAAFAFELEAQRDLRDHFTRAFERPISSKLVEKIDFLTRGRDARDVRFLEGTDPSDLEASYVRILRTDFGRFAITEPPKRDLHRGSELVQRVSAKARLGQYFKKLVMAADFGTFSTVVAAGAMLQIHTGWNFSSVLELDLTSIKRSAGLVEIQSFKARTSDFTPIVIFTSQDTGALQALDFLESRLARMKEFGWVSPDEKDLWIDPQKAVRQASDTFSAWIFALHRLQAKHSLPTFSFEQLRVQVLAAAASARGSLEAARHLAGHANLSTTAHYLDQLIMQRLNSAINLEFQARLERSVTFRMSVDGVPEAGQAEDLLYPIGDGSSCSNPFEPPDATQMDGGICDGKRCHVGGGCANRRVAIDSDRIEELIRTSEFYEANWRRLLLENEEAFRELHLPAFLFSIAVLGIVERGPYRHVARKVQSRVHAELEH